MIYLLALLFTFLPILIIYSTEKNNTLNKIGAVIIAYAFGLILGHIGVIPRPSEFLEAAIQNGVAIDGNQLLNWQKEGLILEKDILAWRIFKLQDLFTSITIPLALPLLLFSLKIKMWFRMSGKTMLSMLFAIISSVVFITIGYYLFEDKIPQANKVAGMLVGLYTGGTPNLASLKEMLSVDADTYIITHTYDTAVSVLYLLFLITIGKYVFRYFLKPYPKVNKTEVFDFIPETEKAYHHFFSKRIVGGLVKALLLSILIVGISGGVSLLVPKSALMLVVILMITSLSIAASFITKVNKLEKSFELGMYFIIVFSLVVATMADINKLIHISSSLLIYISMVVFGTLLFHSILCKIFKIDADTFMVTSTALICSPPFVPMVAGPLGNKEVIVSGLTVGIMGYAIGNYLGVTLAAIL
jgi:uncharacterized membrane protein